MPLRVPRVLAPTLGLVLAGCAVPPSWESSSPARVEGQVVLSGPATGSAYLFLFAPDEAPPEQRGTARAVSAISGERLATGNARFVFSGVAPAAYALWGFLDANGDADLTVDVLAQPGAGDWVPEASVALSVEEGQTSSVQLALTHRVRHPLPAFSVVEQGTGGVLTLTDATPQLTSFTVRSEDFGLVRGETPRFFVKLADTNGDGVPDDVNGDGVPDVWPQFFLRFVPRPGQSVPLDSLGRPAQVLVPLLPNVTPYLGSLNGDVTQEVAATSLQLFVVPLAQAITEEPGKGRAVTTLGAIPIGDYELWAVNDESGVWFVPNGLGRRSTEPISRQALRFQVVHAASGSP